MTDYIAINQLVDHGIAANEFNAGRQALNAGVDLDMQGGVYLKYAQKMLDHGVVSQSQIDDAVKRILTLKFMLGLFEDPYRYCDDTREKKLISTPANLEAAYDMACESMVLLKNESKTLPLKPGLKSPSLVRSPTPSGICWELEQSGDSNKVETVFDCIVKDNSGGQTFFAKGCDIASNDRSKFAEAAKVASQADLLVLVLGESSSMTGEAASRTSINLPGVQTDLLKEIKKSGRPIG